MCTQRGKDVEEALLDTSCQHRVTIENASLDYDARVISPCGLIAWSMFNDTLDLLTAQGQPVCTTAGGCSSGIAWSSDRDVKFKNAEADNIVKTGNNFPQFYYERQQSCSDHPGALNDRWEKRGLGRAGGVRGAGGGGRRAVDGGDGSVAEGETSLERCGGRASPSPALRPARSLLLRCPPLPSTPLPPLPPLPPSLPSLPPLPCALFHPPSWPSALTHAVAPSPRSALFDVCSRTNAGWCFRGSGYCTEDEHFIVWMRTAGLPTFRKLYAKYETTIPAGTYTVRIHNGEHYNNGYYDYYYNPAASAGYFADRSSVLPVNQTFLYPVNTFGGSKAVVLSTSSWIGGKNGLP